MPYIGWSARESSPESRPGLGPRVCSICAGFRCFFRAVFAARYGAPIITLKEESEAEGKSMAPAEGKVDSRRALMLRARTRLRQNVAGSAGARFCIGAITGRNVKSFQILPFAR
jgi:hypothetical protein